MSISYIPNITLCRRFWKFSVSTRSFIFKCWYLSSINLRSDIRFNIRCNYKTWTTRSYSRCSKATRNCLRCTWLSCRSKSKISWSSCSYRLKCSVSFCTLSSSCIICFIKIGNLWFCMSVRCSSFTSKSTFKSWYFRLSNCTYRKGYFTWTTLCNCSTITFIYYSCRNFSNLFICIRICTWNSRRLSFICIFLKSIVRLYCRCISWSTDVKLLIEFCCYRICRCNVR